MPSPKLVLLESFELWDGGTVVSLPLTAQRVLAFVALRTRPLPRTYVAGMLWPDSTDSMARASLRSALWRLHRECPAVVEASGQFVALGPTVSVDVHELRDCARRVLEGDDADLDYSLMSAGLGVELLAGWYEDWVLIERESLRQQSLHALEQLCVRLTATARHAEAVEVGLRAVAIEPLRETAQLALIRAHLSEGNRCEALRQYNSYRQLLRECLGMEPSPNIRALISSLREPTTIE